MKNSASRSRRRLERAHHHEGGAAVLQGAGHGLGPLDEAVVHGLEQDEELGDVAQELRAEDAVGHQVEGLGRGVVEPRPVRRDQPAQQAAGEEVGHALGRLEEVDGVAGGRRVHDDQVVAARRVDLVEPLHGDVVVALDELAGDVLVERVGQDGVAGLVVGGVGAHQVVPRLLGVEHGRPQLAPGLDPGGGEQLVGHPGLDVAELLEAQGAGQPPGRVDGEHQHLAAQVGGRHGARGRGRGGLAHAARAAGDHDLLRPRAAARGCRSAGGLARPAWPAWPVDRPLRRAARATSVADLGGQGLGHRAGGPHAVVAGEQVGHVEQRHVGGSSARSRVRCPARVRRRVTASWAASSTGSTGAAGQRRTAAPATSAGRAARGRPPPRAGRTARAAPC